MARCTSAVISALCAAAVLGLLTPGWSFPQGRRVLVVIAGGLSVRDITRPGLTEFQSLFEEGSAGLMNVRTGRPTKGSEYAARPGMLSGCLSLGAGAMASGGAEVARAYDALSSVGTISAGGLYETRTGRQWSPVAVYHIEIVKMMRVNQEAAYHATPGLLGSALRAEGIRTAVIGNSDMPGEIRREATAVVMDQWGMIDGGTVSSPDLVQPDPDSAFGVRANTKALVALTSAELKRCRFVVVDFGDTLRADFSGESSSDEQTAALRGAAVGRLDSFVSQLRKALDPHHDLLFVVSPSSPSFGESEKERLAPILIIGPGFEQGLLQSPSTRREGVVTLADFAPTVMRFLRVGIPPGTVGRPIASVPGKAPEKVLLRLSEESKRHEERLPAMRGGSVFQAVIVVVATISLVFGGSVSVKSKAAWSALIPTIMPLAMLIMTPFYSGGLVGSVVVLAFLTGVMLAVCVGVFRSPIRALAWSCGALAACLISDIALGSPLMRKSIAGYSLADGARYYGLGNELMGSLLGSTLVAVGLLLASERLPARLRGLLAAAVFGGVFVFVAAPSLGANGGGGIAAAFAFGTVLALRARWRPGARGVIVLALCALAAVAGVFVLDAIRAGQSQSHLGRALAPLLGGDWRGLASIASRKSELNVMLLSTSLWSRLLLVSLAGSGLVAWMLQKPRAKSVRNTELGSASAGLVVGTVAAFVFNDSGVVASAACGVLMWSMLAVTWWEREAGERADRSSASSLD